MLHIAERFLLHFVSACFATLAFYYVIAWLARKSQRVRAWVTGAKQSHLLIAGLLVFAIFPLREPYDVYFGTQVWYKAIFDQLSWLLGAGVSVWGLYRYSKTGMYN